MENYLFFKKELLCFRSNTRAFSTSDRINDGLLSAKSKASARVCRLPAVAGKRGFGALGQGPGAAQQQARLRSVLSRQPRRARLRTSTHRPLSPNEVPAAGTDRPSWGLSSRGDPPPETPQARLLSLGH